MQFKELRAQNYSKSYHKEKNFKRIAINELSDSKQI